LRVGSSFQIRYFPPGSLSQCSSISNLELCLRLTSGLRLMLRPRVLLSTNFQLSSAICFPAVPANRSPTCVGDQSAAVPSNLLPILTGHLFPALSFAALRLASLAAELLAPAFCGRAVHGLLHARPLAFSTSHRLLRALQLLPGANHRFDSVLDTYALRFPQLALRSPPGVRAVRGSPRATDFSVVST